MALTLPLPLTAQQTYASALESTSSAIGGLGSNISRPVDSFFEALQDLDADQVYVYILYIYIYTIYIYIYIYI